MAVIHIHLDQLNPLSKKSHNVCTGTNLKEWLINNLKVNTSSLNITVIRNSITICDSSTQDDKECNLAVNFNLNKNDIINVVVVPAGAELAYAAVAILAAGAVYYLTKPDIPNLQGQTSSSPNNELKSAINSFRVGQAIPDIFGKKRITPDFAAPSYHVYEQNKKVVREVFIVGIGQYEFSDAKLTESPIADMGNAEFATYQPDELLPEEYRKIVIGANTVDGQDLLAPNDNQITQTITSGIQGDNPNNSIFFPKENTVLQDLGLTINSIVNLYAPVSTGGAGPIDGDYTITGITDLVDDTVVDFLEDIPNYGVDNQQPVTYSRTLSSEQQFVNQTEWFVLDETGLDDVLINLQAPQGLQTDGGNRITITIKGFIRRVESTGTGFDYGFEFDFSGNSTAGQYLTVSLSDLGVDFTDPILAGQLEVSLYRETPIDSTNDRDSINLEEIYSVINYTDGELDNSDTAMATLKREATVLALAASSPKFNLIAERKLQLFRNGAVETGFTATRSFADCVFHNLYFVAGLPLSVIDTDALFATLDNMSTPELGYFDYSFDDKNIDINQRIQTACDTCRVLPFKVGARIWSFNRDEERQFSSALINRRNSPVGNNPALNWSFRKPRDFDSVSITYVDQDENAEKTIYRAVDENGVITNTQGVNTNELTLSGCTEVLQAENRADFEIRKIKYQRHTISTTVMGDGLYIGLGDRISFADMNDKQILDGEILGATEVSPGVFNFETSERIEFAFGDTYYGYMTDKDGAINSNAFLVTEWPATEFGFTAEFSEFYLPAGSEQSGSRYILASTEDLDTSEFTVTTRNGRDSNGNVPLELINYDVRIYEND